MVKVAVMGCGIVGSGAVKMLTENADAVSCAAGRQVRLTHVLDVRPIQTPPGVTCVSDFEELLSLGGLNIAVEAIGGTGIAYAFTKRLLEAGVSVVSSNKELVAEHGDELLELARAHNAQYLFEASVGGGTPIIAPIRDCLAGNRITKLEGILNGSTNYLLTRMEQMGLSFPAALAEAKELGYVEANPSADIEGWDARRKLGILANAAFGSKMSDSALIPTEGIARITQGDLDCAHQLGGTIKLIASARLDERGWSGWVNPALVMPEHPLFCVRDVFNGIVVTGDFVGDVLFQGRGAGSLPTASAIVSDIIAVARGAKRQPQHEKSWVAPAFVMQEDEPTRLMVRIESRRADEVSAAVEALMPGAKLQAFQDMLVLLTPPAPHKRLIEQISCLSSTDVRPGIPIRVL